MTASRIYLIGQAVTALADSIMFTTYALYYVQGLSLTPLQLVLVGTAVEVAVLLFEVPTGVVADLYSRRLSVIIGTAVMAGAYLLEGAIPFWSAAFPFFYAVVIAEVVRGLGWTFVSGAEEAWITDEVGTEQVGALHLQSGQLSRLLNLVGIPISVVLANIGLHLPYLTGGLLLLGLAVLQILRMPETAFQPQPRSGESAWQSLVATLQDGIMAVRGRPVLLTLLALTVIGGAASEGVDRLWGAHFLTTFTLAERFVLPPATLFGAFSAAAAVCGILVSGWGRRRLNLADARAVTVTLLASAGLRVLCLVGFALAPNLWTAVAALLAYKAIGTIQGPAYRAWLNGQIDSRVRATVLSFMGQADALGQSGGGPVVGWVGGRWGLRAALTLAAAFLAPAVWVYGRVLGRRAAAEAGEQAGT